jgi:hypothetical protein
MLKPLFGTENSERVLVFLLTRNEGYAREIAQFFDTNLFGIQRQLDKLESGGILVSHTAGRTRLYQFNPRYPFLNELKQLLDKALAFYPEDVRENLMTNRRRPRKRDKPL